MKIKPTTAKIGYYQYPIEYVPNIEIDGEAYFARYLENEKIQVNSNYPESVQKVELLHEILHALDRMTGGDIGEERTRALANVLWTFANENRHIMKFCFGEE